MQAANPTLLSKNTWISSTDLYRYGVCLKPTYFFEAAFNSKNQASNWHVEQIKRKDLPEMAKIARTWSRLAKDKTLDNDWIYDHIANALDQPSPYEEIYACKDRVEQSKGFMILTINPPTIDTECVEILYLATDPKNISYSSHQNNPQRIRGVGSALVHCAEKVARSKSISMVFVSPAGQSTPFYEKQGYTKNKKLGGMTKCL